MSGQEISETVAASALLGLQRLIEAIGVASIAGFGVIEAASLADAVARARGVIVEQQAAEEAFIAPEAIAMVGERYKSVDHLARLQAAAGYCGTCLTGPACRCADRAGRPAAPGIDLRQFRPIVQKERTRLANSVDRMRWQLSEGLRPEVRGIVQPLFDEEQQRLSQADDLLALIDGQLPSALDYTQAPPPGIDLWPVVRQYIAARDQYEEAIRPLNSHAPVRKLPHGSPITRGWVDARELLRRAVGDPTADIFQKKEQDNG